ncbi:Nuclear transcription factor Y subunit C-3 [Spatholobus suberectus]|nr:Nuclear transcription factor Y subunit C-3 [Spatholobus suberectus]
MDQNRRRRSTRLAASQAQVYVTNQHERNQHMLSATTNSRAHVRSQRERLQPMASPLANSRAHVPNQSERTQPMSSPSTDSEAHSALSTIPRGPPQPEPLFDLQLQLFNFWAQQHQEVENTIDFRTHSLPLARIRRIMKRDEDVRMISANACVVFAKACEIFVKELTTRSWVHAEENRRRTLQRGDIATTIAQTDVYDFLVDTVPRDDTMEHDVFTGIYRAGGSAGNIRIAPDYQPMPPPPSNVMGTPYGHPRVIMGRSVSKQARVGNRVTHSMAARAWPQQQQQDDAPPGSDDN